MVEITFQQSLDESINFSCVSSSYVNVTGKQDECDHCHQCVQKIYRWWGASVVCGLHPLCLNINAIALLSPLSMAVGGDDSCTPWPGYAVLNSPKIIAKTKRSLRRAGIKPKACYSYWVGEPIKKMKKLEGESLLGRFCGSLSGGDSKAVRNYGILNLEFLKWRVCFAYVV